MAVHEGLADISFFWSSLDVATFQIPDDMAEGAGFERTVISTPRGFSRPVSSTARPSLRLADFGGLRCGVSIPPACGVFANNGSMPRPANPAIASLAERAHAALGQTAAWRRGTTNRNTARVHGPTIHVGAIRPHPPILRNRHPLRQKTSHAINSLLKRGPLHLLFGIIGIG
jgi:hypothetical protein